MLNNNTCSQQLHQAVLNDICALTGAPQSAVAITRLAAGSLIVEFTVTEHPGVDLSALNSSFANSQQTGDASWLGRTADVYSQFSNESLVVDHVAVSPTIAGSGSSSSHGSSKCGTVCVAVAAVGGVVVVSAVVAAVIAVLVIRKKRACNNDPYKPSADDDSTPVPPSHDVEPIAAIPPPAMVGAVVSAPYACSSTRSHTPSYYGTHGVQYAQPMKPVTKSV